MRIQSRISSKYAIVIAVCGLAASGGLRAQDGCTNATFQGLYGLSVEGVLLPPDAPAPIPFNVAGLMEADGRGTLTVFRQMTNIGGVVAPIDWQAAAEPAVSYAVNADCTATLEFFVPGDSGIPMVPPEGMPFSAALVLIDGGREAYGIQTGPPFAVLTVRLKRTDALDVALRARLDALTGKVASNRQLLERVAVRLGLVP